MPSLAPKKRRRKDSTKGEDAMNELVNVGSVRLKAAARNAPLVGKRPSSPSRIVGSFAEHGHEGKIIKNKLNTSVGMYRKKNIDPTIKVDNLPYVKLQSKNMLGSSLDDKDVLNHHSGPTRFSDPANKLRTTGESFSAVNLLSSREKASYFQVEPHSKLNKENEIEVSPKIRRMEKNGSQMLPDLNSPGDLYSLQRVVRTSLSLGIIIWKLIFRYCNLI